MISLDLGLSSTSRLPNPSVPLPLVLPFKEPRIRMALRLAGCNFHFFQFKFVLVMQFWLKFISRSSTWKGQLLVVEHNACLQALKPVSILYNLKQEDDSRVANLNV
ncbi:hypothetical protein KC19_1G205500 [Ceratodon purpureus]|uniref:Uncharacterized protein n=1 Tax=Ceratodon purpureus TaxID=3225 RepID=A0A8T0JAU6_CERPU|nr:hypothetical protein KC19_1G205500 [Ceratodon purpureus]